MINNRYYSTSMWGRGLGVSLVNTEERQELVNLEVTSSIVWKVGSPQQGINNGIEMEPKIRTVSPMMLRGSAPMCKCKTQTGREKKYSVGVIIMKFMYFNFV